MRAQPERRGDLLVLKRREALEHRPLVAREYGHGRGRAARAHDQNALGRRGEGAVRRVLEEAPERRRAGGPDADQRARVVRARVEPQVLGQVLRGRAPGALSNAR